MSDFEQEEWREAENGRLMVSNLGRVLLVSPNARVKAKPSFGHIAKFGNTTFYRLLPVKGLQRAKNRTYRIHRLVCEAFHGPAPFNNAIVLHIDEDGLNNRADNLRWGTQKENLNMPKVKAYQTTRPRGHRARFLKVEQKGVVNVEA